jgi:outer membrane protein W
MKKLVLIMFAAIVAGSLAFGQVTARGGQIGLQAGTIFTGIGEYTGAIGVKYLVNDAIALRADAGVRHYSYSTNSGTITAYDLGLGLEYHFEGKGGVSPYVGALFNYSGESVSPKVDTPSDLGLMALFGGEYFFSSNFSWAGEARIGYDYYKSAAGDTITTIGTYGFATFLTYYFS